MNKDLKHGDIREIQLNYIKEEELNYIKEIQSDIIKFRIIKIFEQNCLGKLMSSVGKVCGKYILLEKIKEIIETHIGTLGLYENLILCTTSTYLNQIEMIKLLLKSEHKSLQMFLDNVSKNIIPLVHLSDDFLIYHCDRRIPFDDRYNIADSVISIMKIIKDELFQLFISRYDHISRFVDDNLYIIMNPVIASFRRKDKNERGKIIDDICETYMSLLNTIDYSTIKMSIDKCYMTYYFCTLYFIASPLESLYKITRDGEENKTISVNDQEPFSLCKKINLNSNSPRLQIDFRSKFGGDYYDKRKVKSKSLFDSFWKFINQSKVLTEGDKDKLFKSDLDENLLTLFLPRVLVGIVLSYDLIHCRKNMFSRLISILKF